MGCERPITCKGGAWLRAAVVAALLAAVDPVGHVTASGYAWAGARARVQVSLRRRARAREDLVCLRDVARVQGGEPALARRVAGVLLGAASGPGVLRTISRRFVGSRLQQEGISSGDVVFCGESHVAVLPPLSGAAASFEDAIVRAVGTFVADEIDSSLDTVEVDLLSFRWIRRPAAAGRLAFGALRRMGGSGLGRAKYVLDCFDAAGDGRRLGRALAWTDAVHYRAVVVPLRSVAEGAELAPEEVALVTASVRNGGGRLLSDPSEVSRRRAVRPIRAGEPISEAHLVARRLVRRGETVTVVVETPRYRITSRARATRSGARGEVIPVENVGSGREFLARIVGQNLVVVMP